MASPQKENGYTAIANELYDAVARWHFSSYEFRVLIFIIRKTYGWNKKKDKIALSQFVDGTGIKRPHIVRALNMLTKQNIVTKGGNRKMREYSVQKDYEKWSVLPKGARSHHPQVTKGGNRELPKGATKSSAKGGNSVVQKGVHTKDTIHKRQNTTPKPKEKILEPQAALIVEVIHEFEGINPMVGVLYGRPPQREAARRLIDKHGLQRVKNAIAFIELNRDDRFCPSITTPIQLEEKWAALEDYGRKQKSRASGVTNGRGIA